MQSYLHVFPLHSQTPSAHVLRLGQAVCLLAGVPKADLDFAVRLANLSAGSRQRHLLLHHDEHAVADGFLLWAYLTPVAHARLALRSAAPVQPDEWNEGGNLVVLDMVGRPAVRRAMLVELAQQQGREHDTISIIAN